MSRSSRALRSFESEETPFAAPKTLVDARCSILTLDINTTVVRVVHDNVTVQIWCKHVPPFALVNGRRDHTVPLRCVYDDCPAFPDIRNLPEQKTQVGDRRSGSFSLFLYLPVEFPTEYFHTSTIEQFSSLGSQNVTRGKIKMRFNVFAIKGFSRTR